MYEEGIPKNAVIRNIDPTKLTPEAQKHVDEDGALQAKILLGDKIELMGYDFDEYKERVIQGKAEFVYRIHAHNAFIASNVSDFVEASPDHVSAMTLGAFHEAYPDSKSLHHLPASHAMAYYGMNVIVVDTTFHPVSS